MLTPEKVRKLRKLAERATPGPWEMSKWGDGSSGDVSANVIAPSSESTVCHDIMDFDAAFIAASHPTAVLALLDEVERLGKTLLQKNMETIKMPAKLHQCVFYPCLGCGALRKEES